MILDWLDIENGARLTEWNVSLRGNYWRRWNGHRLIVYEVNGWWFWGVVRGKKKVFSGRGYCTANDASDALWNYLEKRNEI